MQILVSGRMKFLPGEKRPGALSPFILETEMQLVQENTLLNGVLINTMAHDSPIRVLNDAEVETIAGGMGPAGAVVGGVIAGTGYAINAAYNGGSWGQFGIAVGTGAAAGFFSGATAMGAIWGFNSTVVGASIGGIASQW